MTDIGDYTTRGECPPEDPRYAIDERWYEDGCIYVLRSWYEDLKQLIEGLSNDLHCSYPGDDMPGVEELERLVLALADWPKPKQTNRAPREGDDE